MFAKIFIVFSICAAVILGEAATDSTPSSKKCEGEQNGIPEEDKFRAGNKSMVFIPYERSWTDALKMCTEKGMKLVAVETAEEQRGIELFLHKRVWGSRKTAAHNVYWNLWTSGADVDSDGYFEWKTLNKPVNFTAWGEGEPNGGSGESCIEMRYVASGTDQQLKWNDSLCWVKKRFICEGV